MIDSNCKRVLSEMSNHCTNYRNYDEMKRGMYGIFRYS